MYLKIDTAGSIPIFEQIGNQVKYAIAMGALRVDEKLPSVRELAVQLRVNPNTVARTYRDLEREGVVYTQRGMGMYVSADAPKLCHNERRRIITERLGTAIEEALGSDLSSDDVREIVESKLNSKSNHKDTKTQRGLEMKSQQ